MPTAHGRKRVGVRGRRPRPRRYAPQAPKFFGNSRVKSGMGCDADTLTVTLAYGLSRWVFQNANSSVADCRSNCANNCGNNVRNNSGLRAGVFGSVGSLGNGNCMNTRNYSLANLQDKVHSALFRRYVCLLCLPYQRRGITSRINADKNALSEQTTQETSGLVTALLYPANVRMFDSIKHYNVGIY